jgi:MFS transporter, FHS family, L-fucose permease
MGYISRRIHAKDELMYKQALLTFSILFFMMGFITAMNDILVPYMKSVFDLDFRQAALIQFCFFGAYGLTSIPASKWIERVGYQRGMISGFIIAACGSMLFWPAVAYNEYYLFLGALFVLASGIVMLQVAANPFVATNGPQDSASSRLSMVQAFNSFGTFMAPLFGSVLILEKLTSSTDQAIGVRTPYLFITLVLVLLAIILSRIQFPKTIISPSEHTRWSMVIKTPGLLAGMLGIFLYVGAEVSIGSFLVNYITSMTRMSPTEAAHLVAIYWGGAMAGRFMGIFTLKEFPPGKVLAVHATMAISLILISINSRGHMAVYSIILVGLCNSIMFPTIFTISLKGLDKMAHKAAGLLGTAILGGAFIPVLTGALADHMNLRVAFALPLLCYLYIAVFGLRKA